MKKILMAVLFAFSSVCFAQTYVSGAVSGVWDSTGSPYYVTDSICVPSGDSLRIGPGVEVIFLGHFKFCINTVASLKAIGTAEDSIIFTAEDTIDGHSGLRFMNTLAVCSLSYCSIEFGNANGVGDDGVGGGISSYYTDLQISHCSFEYNNANEHGGALYFEGGSPKIKDSRILNNRARQNGGGIYFINSTNTIENTFLCDNNSTNGGGIYSESSYASWSNCAFNNDSANWGGAIYFKDFIIGPSKIINNTFLDCDGRTIVMRNIAKVVILNSLFLNNRLYDFDLRHSPSAYNFPCTLFVAYTNTDTTYAYLGTNSVVFWLDGNIDTDTIFADSDMNLFSGSACVNAGTDSFYFNYWDFILHAPSFDINMNPRPLGGGIDLGAKEGSSDYSKPFFDLCPSNDTIFTSETLRAKFRVYDFDGDSLSFYLSGPSSAFIEGDSLIIWIPERADTGSHLFAITACDSEFCDTRSFIIEVLNRAPEFTFCPPGSDEDWRATIRKPFSATDPDSDYIFFTLSGPDGSFIEGDSVVVWTATPEDTGLNIFNIVASDSSNTTGCHFYIPVSNFAPVIQSCPEDMIISYRNIYRRQFNVIESDSFEIVLFGPSGMIVEGDSAICWEPAITDTGEHFVQLVVDDGVFADTCSFTVTVKDGYCGEISGVWDSTGSPYIVVCDVTVPEGDTLIIEPGVEVLFEGEYSFTVDTGAVLKVMGTAEDSVIFTTLVSTAWFKGLKFYSASPECELNYCRVSRSNNIGIEFYYTDMKISNSSIFNNTDIFSRGELGFGIHCDHSNFLLTSTHIKNNREFEPEARSNYSYGGGVCVRNSIIQVYDCIIDSNDAGVNWQVPSSGGGMHFYNSNVTIGKSVFKNNTLKGGDSFWGDVGASVYGGGLHANKSDILVENCMFYNNVAVGGNGGDGYYHEAGGPGGDACGGAICCDSSHIEIINSIFWNNRCNGGIGGMYYLEGYGKVSARDGFGDGGGIFIGGNSFGIFKNIIIANNTVNHYGLNLYLLNSYAVVFNSVIWNLNEPRHEIFCNRSTIGVFSSNARSSAVTFYSTSDSVWSPDNIETPPVFADAASGDFRLHSSSPLIDAGAESVYVAFLDTTFFSPFTDIEGNDRPNGDAWDIGAFESPYSIGNRPPYFVFCPNDTIVPSLAAVQIQFSVADPDSDHISHSIEGPEGAIIEDDFVFWTPDIADTGFQEISIIITDSTYYDTCTFTIEVRACGFPLAGAVSGTLYVDYSPYCIFDDIYVPVGETLIIEPGVHLNYWGNYEFRIDSAAVLKAIGTASDSIIFDICYTSFVPYHAGLFFYHTSESCSLKYTRISNGYSPDDGGAIRIESTDLSVLNSRFENNRAYLSGGAIWADSSNLYFSDNEFISNRADSSSGGGLAVLMSNVEFYKNISQDNVAATYGGGGYFQDSEVFFTQNRFYRDSSLIGSIGLLNSRFNGTSDIYIENIGVVGGGIWLTTTEGIISNSMFYFNKAVYGGGLYIQNLNDLEIVNCILANNIAGIPAPEGGHYIGHGGAIDIRNSSPIIKNCVFVNNRANTRSYGGAIRCRPDSYPIILNCIFIGDSSEYGGDEIYLTYSEDSLSHPCSLSIFNTLIDTSKCEAAEGSFIHFGEGVFFADPEFVDTTLGDYRLRRTSPCLSAGAESVYVEHYYDSVFYAPEYDMLLNRRPNGLAPDLGPYEYYGPNSAPLIANCPFDTALTSWLDTLVYDIDIIDPDDDIIKLSLVDSSLATELIDSVLRIYLPDIADTGEYEIRFVACDPWACDTCAFWVYIPEGIQGIYVLPERYELLAFPNPFNSNVTILTPTIADLEIYDFLGNLVHSATTAKAGKALFNVFPESHNPGRYIWSPDKTLPSGVYLVRARADGEIASRRVVLIK